MDILTWYTLDQFFLVLIKWKEHPIQHDFVVINGVWEKIRLFSLSSRLVSRIRGGHTQKFPACVYSLNLETAVGREKAVQGIYVHREF